METLGAYIDRVMRQKHIKPKALARQCGVTDSYIGRILKGRSDNLTVKTMVMLAEGLGVNAHDIFAAASGIPAAATAQLDPLLLLDHLQKLVHEPTGFAVLQQWLQLPARKRKQLLAFIACLNEPHPEALVKSRQR